MKTAVVYNSIAIGLIPFFFSANLFAANATPINGGKHYVLDVEGRIDPNCAECLRHGLFSSLLAIQEKLNEARTKAEQNDVILHVPEWLVGQLVNSNLLKVQYGPNGAYSDPRDGAPNGTYRAGPLTRSGTYRDTFGNRYEVNCTGIILKDCKVRR